MDSNIKKKSHSYFTPVRWVNAPARRLGRETFAFFRNGRWEWIPEDSVSDIPIRQSKKHITNCPNCGAPYEGKERCEYCGTYLG